MAMHEDHNAEQFLRVDVLTVLIHQECAHQPADGINDCFGHIRSVEKNGWRNGEHDSCKAGQSLHDIGNKHGQHKEG